MYKKTAKKLGESKVLLLTVPLGDRNEGSPPFGILSLQSYARKEGFTNIVFWDCDSERPSDEEIACRVTSENPKIVGISATVSTAYGWVKHVSNVIKLACPDCLIIIGGNLGASAEVVLKKTNVNAVCIGEGERAFVSLLRHYETYGTSEIEKLRGFVFRMGQSCLTNGYEDRIPNESIHDLDWSDLMTASTVDQKDIYFRRAFKNSTPEWWFEHDSRAHSVERKRKRIGTLSVGKGCVARCTFCHRWEKGLRHVPVDTVMQRLSEMVAVYNVGFVDVAIEAFGQDKRWLLEFCDKIKQQNVLWRVVGVRAKCVTPEIVARMHDAGCVSMIYGFESGSQKILNIMEKRTTVEENRDALRWTIQNNMSTVLQLVIGMPGETPKTIEETIQFVREAMSSAKHISSEPIRVNYAQAYPGTPLYEFARRSGYIKAGIDGEEEYLESISNQDASDISHSINFSGFPYLEWASWQDRISAEARIAYRCTFISNFSIGNIVSTTRDWIKASRSFGPLLKLPQSMSERGIRQTVVELWLFFKFVMSRTPTAVSDENLSESLRQSVKNMERIPSDVKEIQFLRDGM